MLDLKALLSDDSFLHHKNLNGKFIIYVNI